MRRSRFFLFWKHFGVQIGVQILFKLIPNQVETFKNRIRGASLVPGVCRRTSMSALGVLRDILDFILECFWAFKSTKSWRIIVVENQVVFRSVFKMILSDLCCNFGVTIGQFRKPCSQTLVFLDSSKTIVFTMHFEARYTNYGAHIHPKTDTN